MAIILIWNILYDLYDYMNPYGMMDWWPSPNSWTSVIQLTIAHAFKPCTPYTWATWVWWWKKHSFCFFSRNICSIINGLIINGLIINGLITNGLITNGLIILVDHLWSYVPVSWMLSTRLAHMIINGIRAIYSIQMDKRQFSLLVWCNHPEKRKQSWHTQI